MCCVPGTCAKTQMIKWRARLGFPRKTEIFENNGLVDSKNLDAFNIRVANVRRLIEEKEKDKPVEGKRFVEYFESRLLPLLQKDVIEPTTAGKISGRWTNNNCESANHVLKSATNWKQSAMPDLIKNPIRNS